VWSAWLGLLVEQILPKPFLTLSDSYVTNPYQHLAFATLEAAVAL
jgi:hypothetical protein